MIRSRTLMAILTAGPLLLLSSTVAAEEEAPLVELRVNAPGWITVYWEHPGTDVSGFRVQREEPAKTWLFQTHVGSYIDMGLAANTAYKYHVCAVYADTEECSDWLTARTMPPEKPPVPHPKPAPTVTKHESYDEPSRIRIWWKKTGDYERVIVRWRHKTSAGALQNDVDTSAREGAYDALTPDPGTYVFLLKGCTLNVFGAANCGDWSAPFEFDTAPPGAARVGCIPGTLKSGSPVFAANGRAEYHFDNPPAGYNTPAGFCHSPERTDVLATYLVHGAWNPTAKPGAWDQSGANTIETFTLRLWPAFSPERAPRRPDVYDSSVTISFLTRARCDRDPWLNASAVCRRTGDNVPQDVRSKWPALLTEPFPHSRNSIPEAERGPLVARYNQVSGQLVGTAKPATDPKNLERAPTLPERPIQGQASRTIETAPTATASATRTEAQSAQPQPSMVDPSADVALNPQLPPKTELLKPRETVMHAPATQTRSAEMTRAATPLQRSPLSKIPPELAAEAEGKELIEFRCRGGDSFHFHPIASDPAAARLRARNQPAEPARFILSFLPPKKNASGNSPPAGEDGGNLESSQCAFADREFAWGNPVGILFDVPMVEPDTASTAGGPPFIRDYLQDPARFWTFTVFKTNYGHFRAVRHGPWTPAGAATGATSAASTDNAANSSAQGGTPAAAANDRGIIIVGGKQSAPTANDRGIIIVGGKQQTTTTADKLKAKPRTEMQRAPDTPNR